MWSLSPVPSFDLWHGIDGSEQQPSPHPGDLQESLQPPNQPFDQPFLPVNQQQIPPEDPQEPLFQPNLFPTPTFTNSMRASPPPVNHLYNEHEFSLLTMLSTTLSHTLLSSSGIKTLIS